MHNYLKYITISLLFLMIHITSAKSFEESFSFLENCAAENAKLPEIVGYPFKFTEDEYLSQMEFSPCELESFDGGFLVFCIQEQFQSLSVSKIVIPFETDFMMVFGLVIDESIDVAFKKLNPLMNVKISSEDMKADDLYGKPLLHKIDENKTLLYCELPDLVN